LKVMEVIARQVLCLSLGKPMKNRYSDLLVPARRSLGGEYMAGFRRNDGPVCRQAGGGERK
ncbi:MAG: hypothetical protein J4F46_10655, partial [Dehalococcoidia bacterium]|nr:hypothetical protein [Dehalococcoidia bacterium]